MNYFTQKYPYEERQGNLTARRRKRHMRKKPKKIKKGEGLLKTIPPYVMAGGGGGGPVGEEEEDLREYPYNAFSMDYRYPYDQTQFPQSNLTARKREAEMREKRTLQSERLKAQQTAARDAREAARASPRARERAMAAQAAAREREIIRERQRNKRLMSAEERTRKRKHGRRQQYEDILLRDMNREIQRPVRIDQLERRIPYQRVIHTPDPLGEKNYLRPFPYKLNIYDIKQKAGGGFPIPGEYLTTRLDIPSEAGPYLEVGFKVPKNYDPYKEAPQRFTKVEVTPLKGISYNYFNQAKFQTKKLLQKGYQKHKDRKESLRSFKTIVKIDKGTPKGETIQQEVLRPNRKKVLVHFKPPDSFPTKEEDPFAYNQERNKHPISFDFNPGDEYPDEGLEYPIKLNLRVTPVSNAYKALKGTKKVGKALGQGLSATGEGIKYAAEQGYEKYQERNRSLESFEAFVSIPAGAEAGSVHEDEVIHQETGKSVKVRFKVPTRFPYIRDHPYLYDERREDSLDPHLARQPYRPQERDFTMVLEVKPISLGYRAKQGTEKVGKGLKKGAYYGALGTAYGIGVPLYGLGVGAVGTAKLARRGIGAAGQAIGTAYQERKESLRSFYHNVFIYPDTPKGQTIKQEIIKPNGERVLVHFKPPTRFPMRERDPYAYNEEEGRENRNPIPIQFEGELYPNMGIDDIIKLNLKVTPVSNAYRALKRTRKVGSDTLAATAVAAGVTRQGITAAGQGIGNFASRKNRQFNEYRAERQRRRAERLAERETQEQLGSDIRPNRSSDEGLFSRLGTKLGNASTATRARLARMTKKKKEEEEEGEELLPLTVQRDSSEYSPDESGTQSSGFSRQSEPDLRLNRTSDEGLFSRFGKRLGNASTAARRRLARITKKKKTGRGRRARIVTTYRSKRFITTFSR